MGFFLLSSDLQLQSDNKQYRGPKAYIPKATSNY